MSRTRIFKRGKKVNQMRIYRIWTAMKQRCYNSKQPNFKYYGDRGITVCGEWIDSFMAFYKWSMANGYKKSLSLDRKNNDGNYSPENCRWADSETQGKNKRVNSRASLYLIGGRAQTAYRWAKELGKSIYQIKKSAKLAA